MRRRCFSSYRVSKFSPVVAAAWHLPSPCSRGCNPHSCRVSLASSVIRLHPRARREASGAMRSIRWCFTATDRMRESPRVRFSSPAAQGCLVSLKFREFSLSRLSSLAREKIARGKLQASLVEAESTRSAFIFSFSFARAFRRGRTNSDAGSVARN